MEDQRFFDAIVIGGGSAGCVLASRLTEDPGRRVLLLEAGPDPVPLPDIIADGTQGNRLILESPYVVMYPTTREADGSTYYPLSGRIMGGGSSVNMMSAPRPTQRDLDGWEAMGNPGWSFQDCLPALKRIESDRDFGDSPYHGTDGPIHVGRPWLLDNIPEGIARTFVDRVIQMGLPLCADTNSPDPYGIGPSVGNIQNGLRQSTSATYLSVARERPNLTVIPNAVVTSLTLDKKRVTGVTYVRDGSVESVASDTVVLSAGVFHSPQILQLSGIGPAGELGRLGIETLHELPGVGENYQDHASVTMTFEGTEGIARNWTPPGCRVYFKSDPTFQGADFHIYLRPPVSIEGLTPMMPVTASLIEHRSRGRVYLADSDPTKLPLIDDALLQHPDDVTAMTAAMRFIHDLTQHESMSTYYGAPVLPEPDEDYADFARKTYDSYHHGVGTCMMGPSQDPMAVVDSTLRVHGLENLFIADASVMPRVTHANTNFTTIMIAERAADFIRDSGR